MKKIISTIVVVALLLLTLTQCKKEDCKEKPNKDCYCPAQYDPVCGCNGKTYGNSCEAQCDGITSYTKGTCK